MKNSVVRENMIEYLVDLLQDAVDYSWPVTKGAHFVLVHRIIDGLASWENLQSVQKIRERFSKPNTNFSQNYSHVHASDSKFDKKQEPKPVPCYKFNKRSGCSELQDHVHANLLLRHVCQTCHQATGAFEKHTKMSCPRNAQLSSKNM